MLYICTYLSFTSVDICPRSVQQGRLLHAEGSFAVGAGPGGAYLSEGGPGGLGDPVEGVDGYADHRGHGHAEADAQGPAGVHVVVVGDRLVLDHREDEDELGRGEEERRSLCPSLTKYQIDHSFTVFCGQLTFNRMLLSW